MVLYHIISSYQLLCAIIHRLKFNQGKKAVLLVPDFYTVKSSDIVNIKNYFFDEVYLFPYMEIPHNAVTISEDTSAAWGKNLPYSLFDFEEIIVAGAQFYFSDLLIKNGIHFSCFEEAAGIFSRPNVLKSIIVNKFPVQAKWAESNKLLDLSNPLIDKVFCLVREQKLSPQLLKARNFDVVKLIFSLPDELIHKLTDYFVHERYEGGRSSVIVLTEQFANLGRMSEDQQRDLYLRMANDLPKNLKIYVKPHPDDMMDYSEIFRGAVIIKEKFPSELLPFIFVEKPDYITSVSSTGEKTLKNFFTSIDSVKYK